MAQSNLSIDTTPWHLSGEKVYKDDLTFLQDAGRATDLVSLTVVSKVSATGKIVPLTNVAAVDGTAIPYGIFIGDDIPSASLVAGDVVDQKVIISGMQGNNSTFQVDQAKIVLENSLTLDTVVSAEDSIRTIREWLESKDIFTVATDNLNITPQPIN